MGPSTPMCINQITLIKFQITVIKVQSTLMLQQQNQRQCEAERVHRLKQEQSAWTYRALKDAQSSIQNLVKTSLTPWANTLRYHSISFSHFTSSVLYVSILQLLVTEQVSSISRQQSRSQDGKIIPPISVQSIKVQYLRSSRLYKVIS